MAQERERWFWILTQDEVWGKDPHALYCFLQHMHPHVEKGGRVFALKTHTFLSFYSPQNFIALAPCYFYLSYGLTCYFCCCWSTVHLQYYISFRCTTWWISIFVDYTPFKVVIKYWLYSLCCTIYFCILFNFWIFLLHYSWVTMLC